MRYIVVSEGFVQVAHTLEDVRRIIRDEMSAADAETFLRELETNHEARYHYKNKLVVAYAMQK